MNNSPRNSILSGNSKATYKTYNMTTKRRNKAYRLKEEEGLYVAKRIFDHYDRDRFGEIDEDKIERMLKDAYRGIIPNFAPSQGHVQSFKKLIDRNGDGSVTQEDLEATVHQYFCQKEDEVDQDLALSTIRDTKSQIWS